MYGVTRFVTPGNHRSGGEAVRKQGLVASVVGLMALGSTAQQLPAVDGEFSGPYHLDFFQGSDPQVVHPQTHEIVHAVDTRLAPIPREYHSVAVMLPDGSILFGGGVGDFGPSESRHTLELYEPAYMFKPRPTVLDVKKPFTGVSTSQKSHDQQYNVNYELVSAGPNATLNRIVLMRAGTATHAFDNSQRYVELNVDMQSVTGPYDDQEVLVTAPTARQAPPGYYLLTVVDDKQRPSIAKWIQVTP